VKRILSILVLAGVSALVALLVVRMRSTRADQSSLGGERRLPGSFDTWPEVPLKHSA
jgi:hypothetical protein